MNTYTVEYTVTHYYTADVEAASAEEAEAIVAASGMALGSEYDLQSEFVQTIKITK